jgi:hypothetical protein
MNEQKNNQKATDGIITGLANLPEEALVSTDDLAAALGCTGRCVRQMVCRGELPAGIIVAGRKVWIVGRVVEFLHRRSADAERKQQEHLEKVRQAI